jgi:hypothetical protein
MSKRFCCEKFQFFYSGEKSMGLNIRITKLSKAFKERSGLLLDKSAFITEGYTNDIMECKKTMTINFCPFCGIKLKDYYYNDDSYVQEEV